MDDDELYDQLLQGKNQQIVNELRERARNSLAVLDYKNYVVFVDNIRMEQQKAIIDFNTFPPVSDQELLSEIEQYLLGITNT